MFRPTSSWACSVPPTRTCAHSNASWPPTSTCAATRSPCPASPPTSRWPSGSSPNSSRSSPAARRLTTDAVRHSVAMLTGTGDESPAEVLTLDILSRRGKTIRPEDAEPEALCRRDRREHHRVRHRPRRHRQDLPGDGQGRQRITDQAGQPDHPHPPGGGSRRAPRLPARHAEREDRPVSAAAVRRAARHDGSGVDPKADERRGDRGRTAGVHAGAGAAGVHRGADPGRVPADRRSRGRRPRHRLRRRADRSARRLSAGLQGDLPSHTQDGSSTLALRRPSVVGRTRRAIGGAASHGGCRRPRR